MKPFLKWDIVHISPCYYLKRKSQEYCEASHGGMPNIQWEASKLDWSRNNLCRVQAEPSLSDVVTVAACLQHCGVDVGLQHCGLQHCGVGVGCNTVVCNTVVCTTVVCNSVVLVCTVVLVLVALVGSWAGQSVQHLMNCHRSGERSGPIAELSDSMDTAAGFELQQMIGMRRWLLWLWSGRANRRIWRIILI